jgi:hypothetical protein
VRSIGGPASGGRCSFYSPRCHRRCRRELVLLQKLFRRGHSAGIKPRNASTALQRKNAIC